MTRVVVLSNYFKPGFKAGGPIKSLDLFCKNLSKELDIHVITSAYDINSKKEYPDIELNKLINRDGYKVIYLSKYNIQNILFYLKRFKPDYIYLNSVFSKQNIFLFLINKITSLPKIILAPRGEISSNALKIKSYKKKPALYFFKLFKVFKDIDFHATDKFEADYLYKMFSNNKIKIIPNFVSSFENPKKLYKVKDKVRACFVSRITPKKNLKYAIKVLSDKKLTKFEIIFDIWGPIEDKEYWLLCQKQIDQLPKNIKVTYKGTYEPKDQIKNLSSYELLILPTLNENFGHVIFECMQLGIVPLISNNTPWTSVKHHGGGAFSLDKKERFVEYLTEFSALDNKKFSNISNMTVQYAKSKSNNLDNKEKYKGLFCEK